MKPTISNKNHRSGCTSLDSHHSSSGPITSMPGESNSSGWNGASARPTLPADVASDIDSMGQAFDGLNLQHRQGCGTGSAAGHALPRAQAATDYHNPRPQYGSYSMVYHPHDACIPPAGLDTSRPRETLSGLAPPTHPSVRDSLAVPGGYESYEGDRSNDLAGHGWQPPRRHRSTHGPRRSRRRNALTASEEEQTYHGNATSCFANDSKHPIQNQYLYPTAISEPDELLIDSTSMPKQVETSNRTFYTPEVSNLESLQVADEPGENDWVVVEAASIPEPLKWYMKMPWVLDMSGRAG